MPPPRRRIGARLVSTGRSCQSKEREGRVMIGWLRRSRDAGVSLVRSPARPAVGRIALGGAGAVAVAGMVLGFGLGAPASGAQIAAGHRGHRAAAEWAGFAGNAQHTAVARKRPQPFRRIRWRAKVDLAPVLQFGTLAIHYGSPMITAANTVLVPTRVSAKAGFRVVAYAGSTRRAALVARHRLSAARLHRWVRRLDASAARGADAQDSPGSCRCRRDGPLAPARERDGRCGPAAGVLRRF